MVDEMKTLVIVGASGHGKVLADIADKNGYERIVFLDDNVEIKQCGGFPVIGKCSEIQNIDSDIIIGIGNANIRKQLQDKFIGKNIVTLIHPNAVIGGNVHIGIGTVVMAGAVVNPGAVIGEGCIINTCASVDHDCKIGDFCHIAVGSHLCGTVILGNNVWIGAGATIKNNVSICHDSIIGAGAVVIDNIIEAGTYVGVPVRKI